MYVCICNRVTEADVRTAVRAAGRSLDAEQLAQRLGLYSESCCGRCAHEMDRVLACLENHTKALAG